MLLEEKLTRMKEEEALRDSSNNSMKGDLLSEYTHLAIDKKAKWELKILFNSSFNLLILCTSILILFLISSIIMLSLITFKVSSLLFLFCKLIFCCASFPSCTRWVSFNSTGVKVRSGLEPLVLAH